MSFGKKLKALLDVYTLNSRKLSSAVHVDPSSISRWINNKRVLQPNSIIVDKILDFILNMDVLEYQRSRFFSLVSPNADISGLNTTQLLKLTKEWLFAPSDQTDTSFKATDSTNGQKINDIQIRELLTDIKKITNKLFYNNDEKFPLKIDEEMIKPGEQKVLEVYRGKDGLQHAMIRLVAELLQSNSIGEILITCQDNFVWYKESYFLKLWMDLLSELIDKGHKVRIIYNLYNGLPEVIYLIQKWLPIITTGKLDAFYYPRYESNTISSTIVVVPGIGCLHSTMSEDEGHSGMTFFYSDYSINEYYKNKFNRLVRDSRILANIFSSSNMLTLLEELPVIEQNPGNRYVFRNGLTSMTLPLDLYKSMLGKSALTKTQQQKRLYLHKHRMEIMKSKKNLLFYKDICPIEALDDMANNSNYAYCLIDIFSTGIVKVDKTDIIEHLRNTVRLLQENDNYEIALVSGNDIFGKNTMYMALKENSAVLISSWDCDGKPSCLMIKESTVVNAFEEYFNTMWEQIPRINRDKNWVVGKLISKMEKLEKSI